MPSTISKIEVNNVKHDIRASKLGNSTVGGTASPIYLEDGIPKECTELLNVEKSSINGNIKINNIETPVYIHPSSTITIKQEGTIKGTFTTNQSGNTTIELSDENTTYSNATQSASGLMSADDKFKSDYTNIAFCTCDTAAATAEKAVTLSGNTKWILKPGAIIIVKFTNSNTASNVTLNVNGTGAKNIWYSTSMYTGTSSTYCGSANRSNTYIYDGTYWVWISSGYMNSYSNASLGHGYGTCSTAETTKAKVVSLSSYSLTTGGIVAVKFTYAVPASATMNINSKGAKAIYYRGAAITAGIIKAGDIATFIYNGSQYHLLTVDRDNNTDTKNTAGSTNTSSKIFLVGATSQAANPQTYSHDTAYVGTDGCVYSGGKKTSVEGHSHYKLSTVTVSASNWIASGNSYTNSLTVNGVTSNSDVQVIPRDDWTDDQRITYINAEILSGSQSSNKVILRAVGAKPVIDFNVDILVGDIIG